MNAWVSIINTKNGIEEPTDDSNQILIFGRYVEVRKSLHTRHCIWVKIILNHIHTGTILLAWYIDPNGIEIINTVKHPYPLCEILVIDTRMVSNNNNTRPTLVTTLQTDCLYNKYTAYVIRLRITLILFTSLQYCSTF